MSDMDPLYQLMQASAQDMSEASVEMKHMMTEDINTDVPIDGYGQMPSFAKQVKNRVGEMTMIYTSESAAQTAINQGRIPNAYIVKIIGGTNNDLVLFYYNNNGTLAPVNDANGVQLTEPTAAAYADLKALFDTTLGSNSTGTLAQFQGANDLTAAVLDDHGQLFAGGDSNQSVDEKASNVVQSRAPGIRTTSKAEGATYDLIDQFGSYFLTGMPESLQNMVQKTASRLNRHLRNRQVFDARDYGLNPFSSEDQWNALQRATLAASAAGGGVVYIPEGAYRLSRPVYPLSNVGYIGPGKKRARLLPFKYSGAFEYRGSKTAYIDNLLFQGFTIDGENQVISPTSGYIPNIKAIFLQFWSNSIIDEMEIINIGATGLGVDMPDNCIISNNAVINCGRLATVGALGASGIGLGTGALNSEPIFVVNNYCKGNKNYGIFFEPQGSGNAQDAITTGNVCIGNYAGIADCGIEGLIVSNNSLRENQHGFLMYPGTNHDGKPGRRGQLHGNIIRGNTVNGITSTCDKTDPLPGEYEFKDNKIYENAVDGINFNYTVSSVENRNNVFQDNEIYRNGRHGIFFEKGNAINVDIIDNRIYNNGRSQAGDAINFAVPLTMGSIVGNRIRDTQTTVTQQRPLALSGNLTDVDISNNHGCGNAQLASITGTETRVNRNNNPGIFEVVA